MWQINKNLENKQEPSHNHIISYRGCSTPPSRVERRVSKNHIFLSMILPETCMQMSSWVYYCKISFKFWVVSLNLITKLFTTSIPLEHRMKHCWSTLFNLRWVSRILLVLFWLATIWDRVVVYACLKIHYPYKTNRSIWEFNVLNQIWYIAS